MSASEGAERLSLHERIISDFGSAQGYQIHPYLDGPSRIEFSW